MDLTFGAGECDRRVAGAEDLLRDWREKERDWGQLYLEYEPATHRDSLVVEDLAVTMLMNSRVASGAATSICRKGATLDLSSLPEKELEETTDEERHVVAEVIGTMASWPWLGASVATKTLHKKRPALIPVLDNMAIFGAYMNPKDLDARAEPLGDAERARLVNDANGWLYKIKFRDPALWLAEILRKVRNRRPE